MKNETEMSETLKDNPQSLPLIPLAKFIKTGRAPVDMYHMIFYNKPSLVKSGVIVRYGRKWLVSEPDLYKWLRTNGKDAGKLN